LQGRVTVVEELGPETLVTLTTVFGDVVTRVRGMQHVDFERRVAFSFDPNGLHLFSLATATSLPRPLESSSREAQASLLQR